MCLWVFKAKRKGRDLEDYRKNKLTGYDASIQTSLSQDLDYPGGLVRAKSSFRVRRPYRGFTGGSITLHLASLHTTKLATFVHLSMNSSLDNLTQSHLIFISSWYGKQRIRLRAVKEDPRNNSSSRVVHINRRATARICKNGVRLLLGPGGAALSMT